MGGGGFGLFQTVYNSILEDLTQRGIIFSKSSSEGKLVCHVLESKCFIK